MNVKIRNAVPDDAAAIQKIIAAGYRRSFAGCTNYWAVKR